MMNERRDEDAGRRAREIRSRQRKKEAMSRYLLIGAVVVLAIAVIVLAIKLFNSGNSDKDTGNDATTTAAISGNTESGGDSQAADDSMQGESGAEASQAPASAPAAGAVSTALEDAELLAAHYDYEGAIAKLESVEAQDSSGAAAAAIEEYTKAEAALVDVDITKVPHIFFHSLIVDPSLAFHNDKARAEDYNRVMTTVTEFNRMMQQMYDRDYVLVSLHQMGEYTDNGDGTGKMTAGKIRLPEGKKPFVLSIDDMSYYAYMMTDGFATKLVIGEDGRLTNEMEKNDGTFEYGSFDVVPLLDDFVIEHPDFSYKGAKGIIALTGYDGVFGYRTDQDYYLKEHLLSNQAEWLDAHPNFDYQKDIEDAKVVAKALREDGWELATHSWGHRDMKDNSYEKFVIDMEKWIDRVESIIGDTDIVIYPFGTDVGSVSPYTMDNEKYAWLHKHGFHYYCNVDSNQPWVQLGNQFLRQGRIDADGYMMYHHPDKLKMFFDVDSVFDSTRPTPVPNY